ncbi:carbamoyltransferase N-terminal domain-containing protein [Nostoc sp.]|uniref:carbamoyltransferase N-terminal domain-containing protein n=1 Tax=Nostoc sp. TaxID=1180 RepID=UPI002FFCDE23
MLVLGFSGGFELISEERPGNLGNAFHDAACVLVEDGKVVCAIEEERLNRIKHTSKFPLESLHFCLKSHGVQLQDVDFIAFYSSMEYAQTSLKLMFLNNPQLTTIEPRIFFQNLFRRALNCEIDEDKFCFVPHHYAHAMSAFAFSGYESSLITTFDGEGENSSGMIFEGKGTILKQIADIPASQSLGHFYWEIITFLGYSEFDEYKVMGLAPYGNPEKYRDLFQTFYTLLPNGDYEIYGDRIISLFDLGIPRRKGEPFTQTHKDIAASLQEALEDMVFHVIKHQKQATKHKNLCLAGGVAHNCTLNGRVLRSGMFENVFVQPAAHDAGCALGSALYAYYQANPMANEKTIENLLNKYCETEEGKAKDIIHDLMELWSQRLIVLRP